MQSENQQRVRITQISMPAFAVLAVVIFVASGCGKATDRAVDRAAIEAAISRIQTGDLVRGIEDAAQGEQFVEGHKSGTRPGNVPDASPDASNVPAVADPCPKVAKPAAGASDQQIDEALTQFGACLRDLAKPAQLAVVAIQYFKIFTMDESDRPLSDLSDVELEGFLGENFEDPVDFYGTSSPRELRLRDSFSDDELGELVRLAERRRAAMVAAESSVFVAMDARPALIAKAATKVDRYALLSALRQSAGDTQGVKTATLVADVTRASRIATPSDLAKFPVAMIHPYALSAVIPDEARELDKLNPQYENPFRVVFEALADLGGEVSQVARTCGNYKILRDIDNPEMPENPAPASDAVRVAFIDTGIDYVSFPDLGLFLGSGRDGQVASGDFADNDENPWLPAIGEYAHGSGTAATLLTIMAQHAPETLRERKLDLAMWKVRTLRSQLSGPYQSFGEWSSRISLQDAVIRRSEGGPGAPKIVSVSMGFSTQFLLDQVKKPDVVSNAPWLWVMAAGNSGVDVQQSRMPSCFGDVPAAQRDDSKILCVGALVQGIVNDKIADYSNFGDRVDVYAFESYIGLCPNGTSCATPAVSGAVAVIAAKFPSLTPQQLKQVIVESSEERELSVDLDMDDPMTRAKVAAGLQETTRKVKVFNPPAMLLRALGVAAKLVGSPSP